MYNAFLVIRTTIFALLILFSILILGFAAWNIHATVTNGRHVPGTPIFMVAASFASICFPGFASLEYFLPKLKSASILIECGWVVVVAMLQLGGAFTITVNGTSYDCRPLGDWSVCSTNFLLISTSWINTLIMFAYLFLLFISTISHGRLYPDVWSQSIYTVDWFVDPKLKNFLEQAMASQKHKPLRLSLYLDDVQSTAARKRLYGSTDDADLEKAPWANNTEVRRGKDDPYAASIAPRSNFRSGCTTPFSPTFSRRQTFSEDHHRHGRSESSVATSMSSSLPTPATENASLPSVPPRIMSKIIHPTSSFGTSSFASKFVERLDRDSRTLSAPNAGPFPAVVENHDMPIPIPHKSQWIRAGSF